MILRAIKDKYPQLDDLRIRSIVASQYTHTVDCVISCFNLGNIDLSTRKDIVNIVYKQTPKGYKMNCKFEDDAFTTTTFAHYILQIINQHFGVMGSLSIDNITVSDMGNCNFDVQMSITDQQHAIYQQCRFEKKFASILNDYSCYKCRFSVTTHKVRKESLDKIIASQNKLEQLSISKIVHAPSRQLAVDFASICYRAKIKAMPRYIFDVRNTASKVIVCGKVSGISQKVSSKNDKLTIVKFTITDPSGSIPVVLFVNKKEEDDMVLRNMQDIEADKAEAMAKRNKAFNDRTRTRLLHLIDGVTVAVEGSANLNEFSNNLEIKADKIQTCNIRAQQMDNYHQCPPSNYTIVKPTILNNTFEQESLFGTNRYVPAALRQDVVLLELSTTGSNVFKDYILSVGCVKISNGVIVARMSTLINPDSKLSTEQVNMYNLNSSQLMYYPTLTEIIPDLFKFCHGCKLIGTDINSNLAMLQYYADARQYLFDNDKSFYLEFINNMLVQEEINNSFPVLKELYKYCNVSVNAKATADEVVQILANCIVKVIDR